VPVAAAAAPAVPGPVTQTFVEKGTLTEAEAGLRAHLKTNPKDAEAQFGLGAVRFLLAVEHLAQNLHRFGSRGGNGGGLVGNLPFLRLPVPENKNPEAVSAAKLRKAFETWVADLDAARTALEAVPPGPVKMPLDLTRVRLDLNADGKADESESLTRIASAMVGPAFAQLAQRGPVVIAFDAADVHWLRGYCHLLAAMGEVALAYDFSEIIPACGHLFFAKVEGAHGFLTEGQKVYDLGGMDIADVIALVHLIRMPVKEPKRMAVALNHLEQMVARSREMWELIRAETDDDHEWIPNANQKSALGGVRMNNEMIGGWLDFLNEAEAMLRGKKLIPFWRGSKAVGVNLRKVFTDPRPFDVVLWIQGTAAAPYLEEGEFTRADTWRRFDRLFQGNFIGFAVWIN
jgi:hypothetical protein